MGVVINITLNYGCGLLCLLEKWMQNQLNCSSISIGSSQLFKTPGELRQLLYEKCMWDFLARGVPWNPWNPSQIRHWLMYSLITPTPSLPLPSTNSLISLHYSIIHTVTYNATHKHVNTRSLTNSFLYSVVLTKMCPLVIKCYSKC